MEGLGREEDRVLDLEQRTKLRIVVGEVVMTVCIAMDESVVT